MTSTGRDHANGARADQRERPTRFRPGSLEDRVEGIAERVVRNQREGKADGAEPELVRWAVERLIRKGDRDPRDRRVLEVVEARSRAMTPAACAAWEKALEQLRETVHEDTFRIWFEPLELLGEYRGWLLIGGPERIVRWVQRRYCELLDRAISQSEFAGARLVKEAEALAA